jgi:hypothetical protein
VLLGLAGGGLLLATPTKEEEAAKEAETKAAEKKASHASAAASMLEWGVKQFNCNLSPTNRSAMCNLPKFLPSLLKLR